MKKKRILTMILAVASCLSLAVSASAASTTTRKATEFKDYDAKAWYAEAVSAAVDNGLLYGKSSTILDPNGDMTRAEMAAILNRSFGCYKANGCDISRFLKRSIGGKDPARRSDTIVRCCPKYS